MMTRSKARRRFPAALPLMPLPLAPPPPEATLQGPAASVIVVGAGLVGLAIVGAAPRESEGEGGERGEEEVEKGRFGHHRSGRGRVEGRERRREEREERGGGATWHIWSHCHMLPGMWSTHHVT